MSLSRAWLLRIWPHKTRMFFAHAAQYTHMVYRYRCRCRHRSGTGICQGTSLGTLTRSAEHELPRAYTCRILLRDACVYVGASRRAQLVCRDYPTNG